MYELLEELEALIEKWENKPYTGDLTKAVYSVCAGELRKIIGNKPASGLPDSIQEALNSGDGVYRP